MFQLLASVQVTNPDHPRFGQAGAVFADNQPGAENIEVRFDLDMQVETVAAADLKAL